MRGWRRMAVVLGAVVAAGVALGDDSALTVKDIMDQLNKGPKALTPLLRRELLAAEPAWGNIQQHARRYAELAEALRTKEPPQGESASWTRLTRQFAETARSLEEAAGRRDKAAAVAVQQKLSRACTPCHQVHRPRQ